MRKGDQQAVLVSAEVAAGFPSPAADYGEEPLNLNTLLITRPSATFFVRVRGDSMTGSGILDGGLLIVDRARKPVNGNVVVAVLFEEFTVKRLVISAGRVLLASDNEAYQPITVHPDSNMEIWGVVTYVIHKTS